MSVSLTNSEAFRYRDIQLHPSANPKKRLAGTVRELTVQPRSKELVKGAREDDTPDFGVGREVVERPV